MTFVQKPRIEFKFCQNLQVEHTLQKSSAALLTLKRALAINPNNPLCKYHRASILHSIDNHEEALQELLQLKEIVPKESDVYFLLGKVSIYIVPLSLAEAISLSCS